MSGCLAALALFARELRAVARARSQLYSSILTPLLFLVFLGTGVSRGLDPANLPAGNATAYMLGGTVVMASVFSSTFAGATYYRDRDSGVLRLLLTAPHSLRVLLLGKGLAGGFLALVQALIVFAIAAPWVELDWQHGVAAGLAIVVGATALLNVVLAGLGQALATRIATMQGFHLVMNLGLFPLLFVSGAFFPIDDLPLWLKILAYANPLTYAVDALQLAAYARDDGGFIGLPIDFAVLVALAVLVGAAGLSRTPRATWSGR